MYFFVLFSPRAYSNIISHDSHNGQKLVILTNTISEVCEHKAF